MANGELRRHVTGPEGLATQLKAARGRMLGKDLADRAGWGGPKVSKIEGGNQLPSEDDLTTWAQITGATDDQLRRWNELLGKAEEMRANLVKIKTLTEKDIITEAVSIRLFDLTFVPRFLQIPAYARAALTQAARLASETIDLDAAVADRMAEARLLYDGEHTFQFVVAEPALRWLVIEPDEMRNQLVSLQFVGHLKNVRFGIIPTSRTVDVFPVNSFELYQTTGFIRTFTGDDITLDRYQVSEYDGILESLWEGAVEGRAAQRLLLSLLDESPQR
jgi:transcriptional regulator with XRE-family HTH domain